MGLPEIIASIEPYKLFYDDLQFDTAKKIMEVMAKKGIDEAKLAKLTGLNKGRVVTMLACDQPFSLLSLAKILMVLDCDCKIIITEKGEKDGESNAVQ